MTLRGRHSRRDEKVKGANVITGFRMEPALAQRLTAYARENFTDERGVADLSHAARALLRQQLRQDPVLDSPGRKLDKATRGMRVDSVLMKGLERSQKEYGFSFLGAVRHLVRRGLGFSEDDSRERENHFATLAASRQGLGLEGAANFGGAGGEGRLKG